MNKLKYINLHGLSHTFASDAIVNGVNFKTIHEQLSHAHVNISIGTYGHLTDEDKAKDLKIFNKLCRLVAFWSLLCRSLKLTYLKTSYIQTFLLKEVSK